MTTLHDTYYLAARARSKLTKEAARGDHDLRVLVSHANLLDSLMDSIHTHKRQQKLATAQRNTVQVEKPAASPLKVQFVLPAKDEYEEAVYDDDYSSDEEETSSSEDSEEDSDEEVEMYTAKQPVVVHDRDVDKRESAQHRQMPTIDEDYVELPVDDNVLPLQVAA